MKVKAQFTLEESNGSKLAPHTKVILQKSTWEPKCNHHTVNTFVLHLYIDEDFNEILSMKY